MCSPEEAVKTLGASDVGVTNENDKTMMLPKITELDEDVRTRMNTGSSSLASAAQKMLGAAGDTQKRLVTRRQRGSDRGSDRGLDTAQKPTQLQALEA